MAPDSTFNGLGIGELRRRQPADDTMRNLLELSREKLDLCARLPVFELEAENEGHAAAAKLFRDLLDTESASFDALKWRLFSEIEATKTDAPRVQPEPRR